MNSFAFKKDKICKINRRYPKNKKYTQYDDNEFDDNIY